MKDLRVAIGPGYPVRLRERFRDVWSCLREDQGDRARLLVVDRNLLRARPDLLAGMRAKERAQVVDLPGGERVKSLRNFERLHRAALEASLPRDGLVVAIGGGTIGDLAGFFAATWMRGVDWCPVATTTLSIADSAVGGKTAVDLGGVKNLVGAFHQPVGVYAALEALETLPGRHRRAGLAEVVKSAVIADEALLRALERNSEALGAGDPQVWARALVGALRVKARVVAQDPREAGQREILNFGHTLGHALEAGVRPRLLHGEAVALGMIAAAWLSERCVAAPAGTQERIVSLLRRLDLVVKRQELDNASVWQNMRYDKKRRGSQLRFVLTPAIGSATVGHPVGRKLLQGALGAVSGVCARGQKPRRSGAMR